MYYLVLYKKNLLTQGLEAASGYIINANNKDEEILLIAFWASVDGMYLWASVAALQLEEIKLLSAVQVM